MIETSPRYATQFTLVAAENATTHITIEHARCSAIIIRRPNGKYVIRVDDPSGKTLGYYTTTADVSRRGTTLLNKALGWY